MLKGNIYPGLPEEPDLPELVTNGKNLLHGVEADAGGLEGVAVQQSLVEAAVRRIETLQHLGLESVRYSWREGGFILNIWASF